MTGDAFSGFLGAISASFKLIISTIFMLVAAGEAAPHMFVVILIIIAVSFFILSLRTPGTWRLWKEGHTTKQRLYSELFFVTDNWRLIREEKRADRAAASLKRCSSAFPKGTTHTCRGEQRRGGRVRPRRASTPLGRRSGAQDGGPGALCWCPQPAGARALRRSSSCEA